MAELLRAEFGEETDVPTGRAAVVTSRRPHGAVVAVDRRSVPDVRLWIAVDDRDEIFGSPDQVDALHDWLTLANVLQFVEPGRFHALTRSGFPRRSGRPQRSPPRRCHVRGRRSPTSPTRSPFDLVGALAALGVPVPEAGHEVDDGEYVVDLAWPDRRIAVSVESDDDRDAWLEANGWMVVPPEAAAVRAAVEGAR